MSSINIKLKSLLVFLVFSFVTLSVSAKDVIYVKSGSSGDGSSWSKAVGNIQQAVDSAAKKGADVWVAKGVYKSDSSAVVYLKPGVNLYGGFDGNETTLAARDTAKYPTVLDGNGKIRVIYQNNDFADTSSVVVDGFVIQNGYADYGGGAYLRKNATINNCIIRNNAVKNYGLAVYASYGKIKNSIICNNSSSNAYRTIYLYHSELDSCVIKNNTAYYGSGVFAEAYSSVSNTKIDSNKNTYYYYESPAYLYNNSKLINCEVTNNYGRNAGVYAYSNCVVKNCSISGNVSSSNSVVHIDYNSKIEDSEVFDNEGVDYEIVYVYNSSSMNRCKVYNNVVDKNHNIVNILNSSSLLNSLIYGNKNVNASSTPLRIHNSKMVNSTFADNETGASYACEFNSVSVTNSIIVSTKFTKVFQNYLSLSGTNTFSYSMIEGGVAGEGNITGSKDFAAFTNPEKGDYSLSNKSYCVNRGKNIEDTIDLLGKTRKQGGAVDMGAIESQYDKANVPSLGKIIYVMKGSNGDGSSWKSAFGDISEAIKIAACDGKKHEIWVAAGTYYGDTVSGASAICLEKGVSLYGGFEGKETTLAARDTAKNPTILDGKNVRRVITQNYGFADSMAVIVDGFTIQNGNVANGGGAYLSTNTTLSNCIVKNNKASSNGSAIFATNATIKNCQILGNTYTNSLQYTVRLNNCKMDSCVLKGNRSGYYAAICAENKSKVTNCQLEGNNSYYNYRGSYFNASEVSNCKFVNTKGSGACVEMSGSSLMTNCLFEGNSDVNNSVVYVNGGSRIEDSQIKNNTTSSNLVYLHEGKANRCSVKGNTTSDRIMTMYYASSSISNSLICNNNCTNAYNEPVYNDRGNILNCTFVNNASKHNKFMNMQNSTLKNSILVGNQTNTNYSGLFNLGGTNTIKNNMLESTFINGNIDGSMTYAAFTDAENGDYTLSANSYCINAGADVADSLDLLGKARKQGGAVDLGAIESSHAKAPVLKSGDIIYVKSGLEGDGTSWETAFGDIQQAIFAASADGKKHQIWVATGTYYGDTTLSTVVNLASGISLYGGFAGKEKSLAARDTANNPTILDGKNARRVITQNYGFADSMAVVVDGFTIQNGYMANGGGAYLSTNTTLSNCIVKLNKASDNGSAIYATNATIKNCQILGNTYANSLQYTVRLNNCKMDSCVLKDNRSGYYAAICAENKSKVTNCLFEGNNSYYNYRGSYFNASEVSNCKFVNTKGSGACAELSGSSLMTNCLFEGNSDVNNSVVYVNGGSRIEDSQIQNNTTSSNLVYLHEGKANRCSVKGNTTSDRIMTMYYASSSISNSLICDNNCTNAYNEPVYNDRGNILNCTFVNNTSKHNKFMNMQNATLKNSILVGNQTNTNYSGLFNLGGTNTIKNNMLESTFINGNIDGSMTYAAFTDAENGDYTLSANSYCINAGADVADSLDLLGKARKQGGAVDLGAIESSHAKAPVLKSGDIIYVKSGLEGDGTSWETAFGDIQQAIFAASADGKKHQIWVATGTYYGDTTLSTVVNLASGISLYGGFAGKEKSLAARDTANNPTILDGKNARRVITQNYGFADSMAVVVDGFTIQNGYMANGGGAYLSTNTTLSNCIVKLNKASDNGSAIYATNATIKNCQILGNTYANSLQYTVRLNNCKMDSCVLKDNRSGYYAAICAENKSKVTNCLFEGNNSYYNYRGSYFNASEVSNCKFVNTKGSGACAELSGSSLMTNCLFEGNSDVNNSVVYVNGGSRIEDCQIQNNTTSSNLVYLHEGKANRCIVKENTTSDRIMTMYYASSSISNSLICNNNCTSTYNEPIYNDRGNILNCTVVNNTTKHEKVMYLSNSTLKNSILVGNKRNAIYSTCLNQNGTNTVKNNMLESMAVDDNIDGSMVFAAFTDAENGDYSLSTNSYCINAGEEVADSLDLNGKARKQGDAVDLGAIESSHAKAPVLKSGDIIYVKSGLEGDGTSWETAFGDIQQAIFAASADGKKHQIWVATGTYYGDTTLSTVVNLAPGISLYGGFAGTETSLAARDTAKNPTILDGKNVRRVITQNYGFADSMAVVVDGFTIQNGYMYNGGGAYLLKNTTLNNSIVKNCRAIESGSAVYANGVNITNSIICDNGAIDYYTNRNAALYLVNSKLDSCIVKKNAAYYTSALQAESTTITNSLFEGNDVCNDYAICLTKSKMSDCKIINHVNKYTSSDQIIYMTSGSTVDRCLIDGNDTYYQMLYITGGSTISNSQITKSKSRSSYLIEIRDNSKMINCTVADNVSNSQTVGCYNTPQILNSIIVGNKRSNNSETVYVNGATINYSMIEGGANGEGNIDGSKSSAAFADAYKGDYSLSGTSLCINAGTNVTDSLDLHKNVRKQSEAVDMGAVESSFTERATVGSIIYVKAGSEGSGLSWDDALGEINQAVTLASTTGKKHQIWVAKGTYIGDTSLVSAISLSAGVSLYGGFAGTESSLDERNTKTNVSIIDGKYKRRCIIQNYDFADSLAIVVDGFTIQNGYLSNNSGVNAKTKKNSTFNNCVFRNARVGNESVYAEKTTFTNCKFTENAIQDLEIYDGVVDSCTFSDNTTTQSNKVIYMKRTKMSNSQICGVSNSYGIVDAIENSIISDCKIMNNKADYYNIVYLSDSKLENSLVCGNEIKSTSYSIISADYTSFITNSTVAHNKTRNRSAISYNYSSSKKYATITNSIIYGNKVTDDVRPQVVVSDYVKVKYCASDGDLTGEHNIKLATSNSGSDASKNYVCFINVAGGDYRLHATSSCIDKGLDSVMTSKTDINGGARIYGKAIDLGAIEYDGEYVQMLDYSQVVCYDRTSLEATFDSTISKIDWKIDYAGNVTGYETTSGTGASIPSMRLRTSGSNVDTLTLKVTPYGKDSVAGTPFNYNYYVYPDFTKKKVTFARPQVAYVVNEQNNNMTIEWNRLLLPVEVDKYELYVWKASQNMPSIPMASFVKDHSKYLSGLDNHTTYKYMVKAAIACDTVCSDIDSFRIDIPVSLEVSGNVNCVFGSKLNETSSLTRYVKGFELTDSITYMISGKDAADFSAKYENGWDKLNGGYLRIFYTPTDVKKQTSDAEITIKSGNSGKYEITLYLAGTLSNYYVYDAVVAKDVYHAGDSVEVTGILTDAYGTPMEGKTLTIEANSNTGFSHSTTGVTDSTGRAPVKFATTKTECGTYSVKVYVGSKSENVVYASFDIPGMAYTGGTTKWTIQKGDTIDGTITITNRSSVALHNLVIETRELADGLQVEFDTLKLLKGSESARIPFRATGTKLTEGKMYLPSVFRVSCDENTTCDFSTYFYCEQPYGQIKVSPANINEYVSKQKPKYINIELTNAGFGETGEVTLSLPDFDGFSVPSTKLASIKSGDTTIVPLKLAYFDGAPINVPFTGSIGVNCANGKSTSLPFRVEYSSQSKGSLEVDVVDEYFYNTADKKHLNGAKVVVRNQYNNQEVASGYTDTTGIVSFDSIPEGSYLLCVKADKHSEYQETIEIQAGQKESKFVFLAYQAITYTWNVERVEIEDKYDINLDFEYETNVPAPVVTLSFPNGVPDKSRFEVGVPKTVRLQITNHGLIAAHYVKFAMPRVPYYRFYVPYNYIDSLPANHTEFVPVTIVRTDDEFGAGGYISSGGSGILLEDESFGTSECPSVHAEYSYVCGVLRQLSAVSQNAWGCPYLVPLTGNGGYSGGGFDIPAYGGGSTGGGHELGNVKNHHYSVNLDIPCNSCLSKVDPWGCAGSLLGMIPIVGPVLSWGTDKLHDALKEDAEARRKRQSCELKDHIDEEEDQNWFESLDTPFNDYTFDKNSPEDLKKKTNAAVSAVYVDKKLFDVDDDDDGGDDDDDDEFISASISDLQTVYTGTKLVCKGLEGELDPYEGIDFVWDQGKDLLDDVKGKIPVIKHVPWSCIDMLCQLNSCDAGRYAENCGRYVYDRVMGNNEEDADTRTTVTTAGDTVMIVDGKIADIHYSDGTRLSELNGPKEPAISKAKFDMQNSIYKVSDARSLAAQDAIEFSGYLQYRGNIMKELAGSENLLSESGIVDYFDYTIKNYSRRKKIDIDSIKKLPSLDLSTTEMVEMAQRWNETLVANENGVYSPNEQYPNIIDQSVVNAYMDSIVNFFNYMQLRKFGTINQLLLSVNKQVHKPSQKSICASVKLHIAQTLTMTREAFDGTLTVNNGNESGAMEGFKVVLEVRNDKGELSNDLFQINTEKLTGISAIDGTGEIAPKSEGTALFRFIPEKGAAPTSPINYSFGGYIVYVDPSSGDTVKADLFPVTLTVNPSPDLQIDYFMQRNILGDDALTLDRVEPSVPAALGVRIDNQGYGIAKNVKLETAQPEIVDNEKGLLIDFAIIGSSLNGKDCDLGSENIDFGNIEAHTAKTGVWWLTSSLLGHFTKYEASVVHANSYGNPELSLVKGIAIHELIKTVDAYGVKDDHVVDFLVNDKDDDNDTPDAIYYSDGGNDEVNQAQRATLDKKKVTTADTVIKLTVIPSKAGWNYAQMSDPGDNCYEIQKVVRVKDSVEIPLSNVWTTFVTLPDGEEPIYENRLHFLDHMTVLGENDYNIYYSVKKNVLKVTEISGVPTGVDAVTSPVDAVVVKFNRKIKNETFDYNDIELYCQGGENLSDPSISVVQQDDYTYLVDISSKTNHSGFYKIEVNVNNILDEYGNAGDFGKNATWSQLLEYDSVVDVWNDNDSIVVYTDHNHIYVKSTKAGTLDIYDILSRLIVKNAKYDEGITQVATLPKGIYIVNGHKVIVR